MLCTVSEWINLAVQWEENHQKEEAANIPPRGVWFCPTSVNIWLLKYHLINFQKVWSLKKLLVARLFKHVHEGQFKEAWSTLNPTTNWNIRH